MDKKIKVIIKRPEEEYGHVEEIANTLEELQRIVGGHIEVFRLSPQVIIICNEEGKIKEMDPNLRIGFEELVGPIIMAGVKGENFASVPCTLEQWSGAVDLNGWRIAK